MALEKDDLQAIADLLKGGKERSVQVADRDSFASFTSGLRDNWPFLMALFAVGFWVVTNIMQINNINISQDGKIDSNASDIKSLSTDFKTFTDGQSSSNSEVIRRLDSLQKDINILTGNNHD